MKALTICQPYAALFLLPADDPRHKRVENREWSTSYRGLIYIHAGKSRDWLTYQVDGIEQSYLLPVESMAFGAVVAIAKLIDCVSIQQIERGEFRRVYPWLATHIHAHGPYCWIFDDVTPIGPWPWRGKQRLFEIDETEIERLATELVADEPHQ